MHVSVKLNPKHESFMLTAFHEMLANSGHNVALVYTKEDLKDPDAEPSLENLGVQPYMLRLVNSVVFRDGNKIVTLHEKSNFRSR